MPKLSLTDFVDVVASSGTPKANKVKQIKNRPPYNPAFDFYKPLRDRIVETHKLANGKKYLDDILPALTDKKKISSYPILIKAYKKWWGKNNSLGLIHLPRFLATTALMLASILSLDYILVENRT